MFEIFIQWTSEAEHKFIVSLEMRKVFFNGLTLLGISSLLFMNTCKLLKLMTFKIY